MLRVVLILSALMTALPAGAADAGSWRKGAKAKPAPFMRVFGDAAPPFGFVRFCERNPAECRVSGNRVTRISATPLRLSELDEVNRSVNEAIAPTTDVELYAQQEFWTLPKDAGDCEDYALLKRKILIQRGWPSSSLLMTVVRDERGDGHAILTVRTSQGDFILDNKVADVKRWHETGYKFIMRQSYVDPRLWMSLDPGAGLRHDAPLTSKPASR